MTEIHKPIPSPIRSPRLKRDPHEEFLFRVGGCITAWATVEEQLFRISVACLGTTPEIAAIVYFRTPSLEARISLVDDLVKFTFPKPLRKSGGHDHEDLKTWNALRENIRKLLVTRNRIAHHRRYTRTTKRRGERPKPDDRTWIEIYLSPDEQLRDRNKTAAPLNINDLNEHLSGVRRIRVLLRHFIHGVLPKHSG